MSARAVFKHFGRRAALNDLNLRVQEEAFYVLIGENGAGKTTLLKSLLGLERVESGTMDVLGMNPDTDGHLVRAQTGYVPERSEIPYRQFRLKDILAHHAAYFDAWESDYADELMEALRLDPMVRLKALSKGEARRIQVVMALAHRPPFLVLDEPTDALDPIAREQFYVLLARHLATTPATVIMSTHHVYEAERLATHVGVLRGGRLTAQVSCDEMQRYLRSSRRGGTMEASLTQLAPSPSRVVRHQIGLLGAPATIMSLAVGLAGIQILVSSGWFAGPTRLMRLPVFDIFPFLVVIGPVAGSLG